MLWKASETFSIFRKIEEKPCVATQTGPKVKIVRCRHTGLKVKTVGSPPTLAQRVLNETLWNPAFFCCWEIEAAQGWDGRVSVAAAIVANCRRLGGSLAAGFQPAQKTRGFPPLARRHF
ncbi:hypothetical protein ACT3RR_10915 [Ewingella sp. AOP8-B2-18]|nr:hypothetical protein [Pseudomonas reactans]